MKQLTYHIKYVGQGWKRWGRGIPWRQITGVACILLVGLCYWLDKEQDQLADKLLRLHVLANSDSAEDQYLKGQVRDELLLTVAPWLEGTENVGEVKEVLKDRLPELTHMAETVVAKAGYPYSVRVELEETWFPTRAYDNFALPAGQYEALRVLIGEGEGQNWWCVVFPPLCVAGSTEQVSQAANDAGLEDRQVFLILEEDEEYVIKFRAMELWEKIKHQFG